MNFKNPLDHPDTANIRKAMQDWTLIKSAEQSTEDTLNQSQGLIQALAEYRDNTDASLCPNWQDIMAFDMAVLNFDAEVGRHCLASDEITGIAFFIGDKIDKARPTPLIDRIIKFNKAFNGTENEPKTVKEFVQHVQPVLEMLDLYIENEFYPTWETKKKWEQSEYYLAEHEAWFQAQWENNSEDSYMLHSIRGTISALNRNLEGQLTEDERKEIRAISAGIVRKSRLI